MDHLDAIERLHRLKESGALSEAEFAEQKARLLALAAAPAAMPEPEPVSEQVSYIVDSPTPQRNLGLIAGLSAAGAAVLGVLVWSFAGGRDEPSAQPSASASVAATDAAAAEATTAAPLLANLPEDERLRLAAMAALGFSGVRRSKDGEQLVITKPLRVLDLPFATVLLTSTERPDDCHACTGFVGVYYLTEVDGTYKVTGKWPEALSGWGWGTVPEWKLSSAFTRNPALVAEGSYTGQGYTCGGINIVELTPKGPVASDVVANFASNSGAVDPDTGRTSLGDPERTWEGKIVRVVKGQSFEVEVPGPDGFTERYEMKGGKFVRTSGETKLAC